MKNYNLTPIPIRERQVAKEYINALPAKLKKKLLSVGCGDGKELLDYVEIFEKIKGIDFSSYSVKLAKQNTRNCPNIEIEKQDLLKMSETEKYDVCLMMAVLEHVPEDGRALDKISRLLDEKGYLIFGVPAHKKYYGLHDDRVGHFRRYEKKELYDKLQQSGFKVRDFKCIGFPLGNLVYLIYNQLLKIFGKKMFNYNQSPIEKSKITAPGTESKLPEGFGFLIKFSPLIAGLISFFDRFFADKDWGMYYLISAQKI